MKILKINQKNLKIAIDVLQKDGTVVFPTETVYGLAGDPFNQETINKIYKIKGRGFDKPLPLIADSFKTIEKYFKLNKIELDLAKKHWPGALTIILKLKNKKNNLKYLNKFGNNIAVRVSSDKLARKLANSLNGLVISTSANVSGEPECYSASAVIRQFKDKKYKPDLILDTGRLKKQKSSTIILVKGKKNNILRQGEIKL